MGTAISTSVMPAAMPQSNTAQTYEVVSDTALKAGSNINLPAKSLVATNVGTTIALPKFTLAVADTQNKLDAWIDGLIKKESNGRNGLITLDVNGHYSYGCLQFQMPTFIAYGRKYGVITGEESNLDTLVMNCNIQKAIAKKMILDDAANWRHWYTSVALKNLGLPPVN